MYPILFILHRSHRKLSFKFSFNTPSFAIARSLLVCMWLFLLFFNVFVSFVKCGIYKFFFVFELHQKRMSQANPLIRIRIQSFFFLIMFNLENVCVFLYGIECFFFVLLLLFPCVWFVFILYEISYSFMSDGLAVLLFLLFLVFKVQLQYRTI